MEFKGGVKKQVIVLATSTSVIVPKEEAVDENLGFNLVKVLCIRYSINFRKNSVSTFFDLGSEINIVYLIFAKELSLPIRLTDVRVQKIDSITLDTYGKEVVAFSMKEKANWVRFFKEIFLMANVSPEIVFEMPFLTLSETDVDFLG